MASSHSYPSQWSLPYRLGWQADGFLHTARLWWAFTGLGAFLILTFSLGLFAGVLTQDQWIVFTGLGLMFGLAMGARAQWLCVQAQRLGQVHALCECMKGAPQAWYEFALARKAYEYAHQDDWVQLCAAALVFALGVSFLVVHGIGSFWVAPGLWLLGSGVWLARLAIRYRARQRLMFHLGPSPEVEPREHQRVVQNEKLSKMSPSTSPTA